MDKLYDEFKRKAYLQSTVIAAFINPTYKSKTE